MERKYFKVGVSVNFGKEINLREQLEKLVEVAQDYTKKCNYNKVLNLISVEEDTLYFLITFYNRPLEEFKLRSVMGFLKRVCSIFDYNYDGKKKYFSLIEWLPVSREEYPYMLSEGTINIGETFKEIMKNKKEESEEIDKESKKNVVEIDNENNSLIDQEEIEKPIRKFPTLQNVSNRMNENDKKDTLESTTLRDTLSQLDDLIGVEVIKEKIKEITSFIMRNNERCVRLNIDNPGLYYNIAIMGNKGTGKDTIAKILYHIYYHLGVIGKGKFITIDSKDVYPGYSLDKQLGNTQSGVILINNAHLISASDKRGSVSYLDTLEEWFSVYKRNFVFILSGETGGINELLKNERVKNYMDFFIDIPDFNEIEALELVKHFAKHEKYKIEDNANEEIIKYISYLKEKDSFENVYTARRIIEKAIINNGIINDYNYLLKEDFKFEGYSDFEKSEHVEVSEVNPVEQLEELIGLSEVKQKVKEISDYVESQLRRKNLGLISEPLCLHMSYVGNPGTGKTTVARIMGKILNKLGVLSTGNFVEVSREDIIGKYVGHTAIKTAEKIKEAVGGVLFIDEAHSLNSESKIDYGYEAVSTIVKKMEDLRESIVVIFAGYQKEMESFIIMNPGLRDRVQFKLEFEDYKPTELLEIWQKFLNDSQYKIEDEALAEMENIINKIYKNRNCNFSNGRIMRKCFERVKMQQAVRVIKDNLTDVEDLVKINIDDIKKLYEDQDIAEMLKEIVSKRTIGFAM